MRAALAARPRTGYGPNMVPPDGTPPRWSGLLLSTALLGACQAPSKSEAPTLQVAAASDLSLAFEELGKLYETQSGHKVTFAFGASGVLAKQLGQGAPFDLFAAASASFADSAVASGACDGSTKRVYARGHVVAWSRRQGPALRSLNDLRNPSVTRIAIANPDHAPYGKAAREALVRAGLWAELEPKLVPAENVRQALEFAQTGNVDVALVALSLVASDHQGHRLTIDSALYAPLEQTLVVCRHGKSPAWARDFAALVTSSQGQAVLSRYGFGPGGRDVADGKTQPAPSKP